MKRRSFLKNEADVSISKYRLVALSPSVTKLSEIARFRISILWRRVKPTQQDQRNRSFPRDCVPLWRTGQAPVRFFIENLAIDILRAPRYTQSPTTTSVDFFRRVTITRWHARSLRNVLCFCRTFLTRRSERSWEIYFSNFLDRAAPRIDSSWSDFFAWLSVRSPFLSPWFSCGLKFTASFADAFESSRSRRKRYNGIPTFHRKAGTLELGQIAGANHLHHLATVLL